MEPELLGELASRKRGKGMLFEFFCRKGSRMILRNGEAGKTFGTAADHGSLILVHRQVFITIFYSTKSLFRAVSEYAYYFLQSHESKRVVLLPTVVLYPTHAAVYLELPQP